FGETVEFLGFGAFALDVEGLRRFLLHPECQLEGGDAGAEAAVVFAALLVEGVEAPQEGELRLLAVARELGVADVGDRTLQVGDERALVGRRKEAGAPERRSLGRLRGA